MNDPSEHDDGYREELGPQDKSDFNKLFKKKYRSIDEERARESFERSFESGEEAEYRLFRDVVNAFSSKQGGFEALIVNPLYEFGHPKAEVLLAKPQANSVHLCFVACEVGGHNYMDWSTRINETHQLTNDAKAIEGLKKHIHCSELDVGSIQHATITRDIDIPDANIRILKAGTDPEYYAIWKLIRSAEYNEQTEEMEEDKTIKYHDGNMAVPDFKTICQRGIDPKAFDNDDIKYCLTSHPVFPLGEVCLSLYLSRYDADENPKEFYQSDFKETYLENIHFGNGRGAMTSIAENQVEELLKFGLEHGILKDDSDTVDERDFKIMWTGEDAGDIKPMVKLKFIDSKIPAETGDMAFSLAKEAHEKGEHSLSDFTDAN